MMKKLISAVALFTGLAGLAALSGCSDVPTGSLLEGVKPGPDGKINVVTVFSHPDDETFYTGGTLPEDEKGSEGQAPHSLLDQRQHGRGKGKSRDYEDQLGKFRKKS